VVVIDPQPDITKLRNISNAAIMILLNADFAGRLIVAK
jgi:hypothetical protein